MNESFVDSINLKETGYNRIMAEEFFVWLKHEIVKVKRHKGPIEYLDSFNIFPSKQDLTSWSNFSLVLFGKE